MGVIMTKTNKLLTTALLISALSTAFAQAISLVNFDMSLLKPLNAESKQVEVQTAETMEATRSMYSSGKDYLKAVYNRTKEQLKLICARLKAAYKDARSNGDASWYVKKQTYKAYKKYIYENWKKTRLFPAL